MSASEQATGIHPKQLDVSFLAGAVLASATLNVPQGARGLVVVFSNEGTARFDPGTRFVAEVLEQSGLATLALDPLVPCTENEVIGVVSWLRRESFTAQLPLGLLASHDCARPVTSAAVVLNLPSAVLTETAAANAAELAAEQFLRRLTV